MLHLRRIGLKSRKASSPLVAVGVLLVILGLSPSLRAQPFPSDPVKEIRNSMVATPDSRPITPEQIENLRTLGDIGEATQLLNQSRDRDRAEQAQLRERLSQKFDKAARQGLQKPETRWASLTLLADLASGERAASSPNFYLRTNLVQLIPEFAKLTKDPDPRIRASAVTTLGNALAVITPAYVEGDPKNLTKPIEDLLLSSKIRSDREAAAEGLGNIVRTPVGFETADITDIKDAAITINKRFAKDQTLAVYSRFPKTKFLGRLLITDVDPDVDNQSIGKFVGKPLEPVEKGDQVSTRVDLNNDVIAIASKKILSPERERDVVVRRLTVYALELTTAGTQSLIREENDQELTNQLPFFRVLRDAAKALAVATQDPDSQVRLSALRTMEDIGVIRERLRPLRPGLPPEAQTVLPAPLKEALPALARTIVEDPDAQCRLTGVEALERIPDILGQGSPETDAAIRALGKALRDRRSPFVRWAAARTLGRVAPALPNEVLPGLTWLVSDPGSDLDVHNAAAVAIRRYGETQAKAATPIDPHVLAAAVKALAWTTGQGFPYFVVNGVYHGDSSIRLNAIRALDAIGEAAAPAIPDLILALGDPDMEVRQNAALVLGRFGKKALSAKPALEKALGDPEPEVRRYVSEALLRIIEQ